MKEKGKEEKGDEKKEEQYNQSESESSNLDDAWEDIGCEQRESLGDGEKLRDHLNQPQPTPDNFIPHPFHHGLRRVFTA